MSEASNGLRLKYGLGHIPSEQEVGRWLGVVKLLIEKGYTKEDAGRMAAGQIFTDYQTNFFASESDSIETLLRVAENK